MISYERSGIQKVFNIELDIKKSNPTQEFEVVEGDTENVFNISLFDEETPVMLGSCRVLAVFSHSEGVVCQDSETPGSGVSVNDNNVKILLKTKSFSPGLVECEIQVYGTKDYSLCTSARFSFYCRGAMFKGDGIESDSLYSPLLGLVHQVNMATLQVSEALVTANLVLESATSTGNIIANIYLHRIYCDKDPLANGFNVELSNTPNDYIGTCVTASSIAPTEPSEYTWFKWKGEQGIAGINSFIHIRYADTDPKLSAVELQAVPADYMGICISLNSEASDEPGDYNWYRIRGDQGTHVSGASVDTAGNLILNLSDSSIINAGRVVGRDGMQGEQGVSGAAGRDGADGISILAAHINAEGSLVLDRSDQTSITVGKVVGSDGLPGPKGDPGEDGTSYEWLTSSSNPVSTMGKVGDMYLDTSTNDVYKKTSPTVWTKQGNIMGKSIDNISISETGKIVIGMTDDTTRESGIIITDAITSSSGLAVSSRAVYEAIGNIETLLAAL